MHKGRAYELAQECRIYCVEYPYPLWAPKSWTCTVHTFSGTAAALTPTGNLIVPFKEINASLEAVYECTLFDMGSGVYAKLQAFYWMESPTSCAGRIGGDWGVNGNLPDHPRYHYTQPWNGINKGFSPGISAPELYLAPTALLWEPTEY